MPQPLATTARRIRREIIEMAYRSAGPHVGSALSCTDILTTLYFGRMKFSSWESRDICILSKAHASMALYATLAEKGILPQELLATYCCDHGLPAHLDRQTGYGVECSAGSLGHGFNIGLGMAYGFKLRGEDRQVYTIIGDGESQEGAIWEGALFAPSQGLSNVTAIMDRNNLQGYGRATEICSFEPIAEKWRAFGWHVCTVNGHDHGEILAALDEATNGKPKMIIARTIKGKGVSFMEDQLIWHYYIVTAMHRDAALKELA